MAEPVGTGPAEAHVLVQVEEEPAPTTSAKKQKLDKRPRPLPKPRVMAEQPVKQEDEEDYRTLSPEEVWDRLKNALVA